MGRTIAIAALLASLASLSWAAGKATKIEVLGLAFEAPGTWSRVERDDPDLAVYQPPDIPAQITVSVLRSEERMDSRARRRTVDALVEHRQEGERRAMNGSVSFKPVRNSERNGLTIASYCGVDGVSGHPFATMVLASADSAWTIFYETQQAPASSFCSGGERLFRTVRALKR